MTKHCIDNICRHTRSENFNQKCEKCMMCKENTIFTNAFLQALQLKDSKQKDHQEDLKTNYQNS